MIVNANPIITEVEKKIIDNYFFVGFLDLKSDGQAPTGEGKVDLEDESSTGTNNK